jgi:hypothetical protein
MIIYSFFISFLHLILILDFSVFSALFFAFFTLFFAFFTLVYSGFLTLLLLEILLISLFSFFFLLVVRRRSLFWLIFEYWGWLNIKKSLQIFFDFFKPYVNKLFIVLHSKMTNELDYHHDQIYK